MNSTFKNALVSVSDKTGLVEFLRPLAEKGLRIVSTGGTAKVLMQAGFKVIDISEQTGFPEVMDGRVKTLHPRVHMALLSREGVKEDEDLLKKEGLEPFDLLVVNLYPFEEALKKNLSDEEQIEFIDIGGPSLLRAAAKNFGRLTVVTDPADYSWIAEQGNTRLEQRRGLAAKVFSHTASYDSLISQYLGADEKFPAFALGGLFQQSLRYGENPQQRAGWYRRPGAAHGLHEGRILQGKELSYNNLLDLDAAVGTLQEFKEQKAVVAVKHLNPCGVAVGEKSEAVLSAALKADPVSVFGGIIAMNFILDVAEAKQLSELFLECIVAPEVTSAAKEIFAKKKNLRVLEWPDLMQADSFYRVRSVMGGFLLQTPDQVAGWSDAWKVVGEKPSPEVKRDLSLAWRICAHLKSNAIAVAGEGLSLGLGMGQVNRVDAVEQALLRWHKHHPEVKHPVLASDAFFPFPDSVERAAEAGIRWIVQPGGSVKDEDVLARARELGVNMVLTGTRHFQH
jgi:phosphoribosylaminoimidazolecarboxamide formyltransferase/IMP cyclohydrolase